MVSSTTTSALEEQAPLVVHVIPETGSAGAEKQARRLIAGLVERGRFAPEIAYFRAGVGHPAFAQLGVPMRYLGHRGPLALDWPRRLWALQRAYGAAQPPAIVHGWLDEGNLIAALAACCWPQTRVVISQRCAAGAYHAQRRWPLALRAVRRFVDHAVANSGDGVAFLRGLGYAPQIVSQIGNGNPSADLDIDVDRLRSVARRALDIAEHVHVVGYIGRADPMKDLGCLFAAVELVQRSIADVRLLLLGPDPKALDRMGLRLPPGASALGWRADAAELVAAFDVLALSSRSEGHSNAVDEALLAGVPVVTTAVGEHPELVAKAFGRVVPVGAAAALGEAIGALLRDPPSRGAVRARAVGALSLAPVLDATEDLYRSLLQMSPSCLTARRR